ncbi:MAG: ATP-binding cassette domain-containing protein [Phycisphaerales bacterium]|nr:ATP-binding cassette domain-containing protein [Phycisphaerales bacterium]
MMSGLSPARRPAAGTPVVAARGLTKVFRDFWMRQRARAVDHLSFEIQPNEIFGLLGPNGSGKSTTIKMILGLLRPTSGQLLVLGKQPTDVPMKALIGYLPEESYLYGFLNARETLDYYGKLFGLLRRERRQRMDELIEMVGLRGAQFRPVREYSKGMQRRIGIAQALINDPQFLILDEPTTGLDPIGTRQVKDLIIELGRRGKTILLSSHLLADVEDCVDRMIILYGGQKRDEGTCDALLNRTSRTTIETEALDEATIAEIDALIRRRTGGEQAILRVSHPRQKLEEKFLDIVERARAERLETSGATSGGDVASFLKGGAMAGEALIHKLVQGDADTNVPPPEVEAPRTPAAAEPEQAVIDQLLGRAPEPEPEPARRAAPPSSRPLETGDVDRSLIDALISKPDGDAGADARGREP